MSCVAVAQIAEGLNITSAACNNSVAQDMPKATRGAMTLR